MARRFNGSSDFIVFTLSTALETLDAGPLTMAVLASVTSTTDGAFIHSRTSGGTNSWWMETFSTQWNYGQGNTGKDIGDVTTSEGWAVYAGHKANGGAALAVGRKVILGGSTTEVTAGTGLADGTAPGAGGILQVGKFGTSSEFFGGDIACAAVWDYELSQAEIDALATDFANWSDTTTAPKWLVKFTQANAADPISDETGNGGGSSSITGTTIVADPTDFFDSGNPPVVLGQALEADTATTLARTKLRAVGQAAEADTATVLSRSKRLTLGQPAEANTATALSRTKQWSVGQATETNAATTLTRTKRITWGQPAETDTAGALTIAGGAVLLGQAVEIDTATALSRSKTRTLAAALERDTAGAFNGAPAHDLQLTVGAPQTRWTTGLPSADWSADEPRPKWTTGLPEV